MSRWCLTGAVLAVLCFAGGTARADRVHLQGGGVIEVDTWRFEGDWFVYEGPAGTVALPRSSIVKIERSGAGQRAPSGTSRHPSPPKDAARLDPSERERARASLAEGAAALERRDFEAASAAFERALLFDPGLVPARVGLVVAEMRLGRDARALDAVLEGVRRHPERPEFHELLGDLRDREDRLEDALAAWERALALAPNDRLREKIERARHDLLAAREQRASSSAHFWLRHEATLPRELEAAILDHLEARYDDFAALFRDSPAPPILVVVYPEGQFRHVTGSSEAVAGLFDGKIRLPLAGRRQLDPVTRGVLDHELTHAFVHAKSRGHAPRWLHEGLAQRMEGRRLGAAERERVRRLLQERGPESWTEPPSYPAALAFVRYLESRRGLDALAWLVARLGDGLDLDAALNEIYGEDFRSLSRRWARQFLESEP